MDKNLIPEDIRALSHKRIHAFRELTHTPQPFLSLIAPGQIWSTHSHITLDSLGSFDTEEPRLIVILAVYEPVTGVLDQLTAAPISPEIAMATSHDFIVRGDDSPLGFDFIIELWNETPVVVKHFRNFLGALDHERVAPALFDLYNARLHHQPIPAEFENRIGLPVFDSNDTRLDFQKAEIAAVQYLANAATVVLLLDERSDEKHIHTVSVKPTLGKISQFVPPSRRPIVAAASSIEERDVWLVHSDSFTLEFLHKQKSPFTIYAIVHDISPQFEGGMGRIRVKTVSGEMQSTDVRFQRDSRIEVGDDSHFSFDQIEQVMVEISQD